jgi:hypothetical protein
MLQRSSRLVKKFFCALGRGLLEQLDIADLLGEGIGGFEGIGGVLGVVGLAAFCIVFVCLVYAFFQVGYELMFDPNATDVAARLASISISPEKWM